jgi:hypothetical protein
VAVKGGGTEVSCNPRKNVFSIGASDPFIYTGHFFSPIEKTLPYLPLYKIIPYRGLTFSYGLHILGSNKKKFI